MSFFGDIFCLVRTIEDSVRVAWRYFAEFRFVNTDGSWCVDNVEMFLKKAARYDGECRDTFEHIINHTSIDTIKDTLTNTGDIPVAVIAQVLYFTGTLDDPKADITKKALIEKCSERDLRILQFCLDKKRKDDDWVRNVYLPQHPELNTNK